MHLAALAVDAGDLALEETHLRRAEKTGHKQVGWLVVQLQRRADLFDAPTVEHHHLVGQGHGFDLVVGHVDHGRLQFFMQARQLQAHLHAQGGVEVGQRFVEQEDLRVAHNRSANRHALALATRKLLGLALQQRPQLKDARRFADFALDQLLVDARQVQGKRHVLAHAHVRVQRVGLEHHGQVALGRGDFGDVAAIEFDGAVADFFQAGDQAQQGGFATARRADEHHEFLVVHFQVDALDDGKTFEAFLQILDFQVGHDGPPFRIII